MGNVTLTEVYKHVVHIEKRLNRLEDILQIPEVEVPHAELKKYKTTLKRMQEGKEGISWGDYKKSRS